jgi:hypothetical protein
VAPKGDPVDEQVYVFVVKLWQEQREIPEADPLWRGSIENALSGERRYFSTKAELYEHLCQQSGMRMPLRPSRTRRVLRLHRR